MKNSEIIVKEAIQAGLYTEDEVKRILQKDGCLPLHTFEGWKQKYGLVVKKGEHAVITTKLWRRKTQKEEEKENPKERENKTSYHMVKAFLFTREQVEPIKIKEG